MYTIALIFTYAGFQLHNLPVTSLHRTQQINIQTKPNNQQITH